NGLLHLGTRKLHAHSAQCFNLRAVEFKIDAKAPPPARWHQFLAALWPKDPEAVAALQEWLGYLLTSDTRQQKIFLLVGPPRAGKGTIAGVLQALVGHDSVVSPTLGSLSER